MIIEQHEVRGRIVDVYREDLRVGEPFVAHGKTPALIKLFEKLGDEGWASVSCFASRGSDWALNAAICASNEEIELTIFSQQATKNFPVPEFIERARDEHGAKIEFIRVNTTPIMSGQAKKIAHARDSFFIPFGLELKIVIDELSERLRGIAAKSPTLVLCAGSGVTLGCALRAALYDQQRFVKVVAVSSGRSARAITTTATRVASLHDRVLGDAVQELLVIEGGRYGDAASEPAIESPWPTHVFYERKAFAWLHENVARFDKEMIGFLNM
jgi:hypothetical protein